MVVEAWLARAATARPDHTALQTPQQEMSYAELYAAARDGAGELSARGAAPGLRVAIALAPGPAFVRALHACMLLGAVAVPVDLRLAPAERSRITEGTSVVVEEPLSHGAGARNIALAESHDLSATAAVIHTSGKIGRAHV